MTKQITDHYAIIPTGQGLNALRSVSVQGEKVYEVIVRRFLSIFYPPAVYQKISLVSVREKERLFSSFKVLVSEGYLKVSGNSFGKKKRRILGRRKISEERNFLELILGISEKEVFSPSNGFS